MELLKVAVLQLTNVNLKHSQIHKLRGYIGNLFKDYDIIHNHNQTTGQYIYRYPLIQFKIINKTPTLLAISDKAINIFSEIFLKLQTITIDNNTIPIHEKNLNIMNDHFGFSDKWHSYEFISPWLALNQKNYLLYQTKQPISQKEVFLSKILTGNILSMSKDLGVWLDQDKRIVVNTSVQPIQVKLKGEEMTAFKGMFITNYLISDYLGIGKSVSRGFGVVKRLM